MTIVREMLRNAAASAAHEAGREELKRRELRRIEQAGSIAKLLMELGEKPVPMDDLVQDRERFRNLVRIRDFSRGPARSDLGQLSKVKLDDGANFALTPGRHIFPYLRGKEIPMGVKISGSGMDQTILSGTLRAEGMILGLVVEDLTLISQDCFDTDKLLSLVLLRVRAAGYNTGAGGSDFMDVRSGNIAICADSCVFDGTVGRGGMKHATVFSLSCDAKLLRFDNCEFIGNGDVIQNWGTYSAHFQDCIFKKNREAYCREASYAGCTFEGNDDVLDGYYPGKPKLKENR
jgi:hypothetical protein